MSCVLRGELLTLKKMANKLLPRDISLNQTKKTLKRFHVPNFNGKFGFSVFVGTKEVFIGVSVGEVEIEHIVRKKLLRMPSRVKVRTYNFDNTVEEAI